ncbi:LysR substrate-binding domain-containing protein [Sphingomonas sp. BN140010]|uniref:LysR substrate-binding domain-containing protein n=1 Tax=Sphingomonas arvum TaxID=2992113 RepID=A0ABT3JCE3_9SPHN|nr:LysR substrate-binding domain-containing protein [Sphingomonas sp. BN140010]MCW3796742.1 LysR substrate-binding domain-containing protein [Sphingomonas sp. BN140010]
MATIDGVNGLMNRNLDLDLLRCFSVIAAEGSFTKAGERLGRTQSTISLQVKRLEEQLGLSLFDRTSRSLALTPDGDRLLGPARELLRLHDVTLAKITEPDFSGVVRLGVPEDFATAHLPQVLAAFAEAHPLVDLEVTCDLTLNLLERFRAGDFDLVLVKREPKGSGGGARVWREALLWVARPSFPIREIDPLPLVVSPTPCVYRKRACDALNAIGRRWRVAYTSTSLAGAQSAVRAGLGITVLPQNMIPAGLEPVSPAAMLPALHDTEVALLVAHAPAEPARRLAQHIRDALSH